MNSVKVGISMDRSTLAKVDRMTKREDFPSRSKAIQTAVDAHLLRLDLGRLARECRKLDPAAEAKAADEGLAADLASWAEY